MNADIVVAVLFVTWLGVYGYIAGAMGERAIPKFARPFVNGMWDRLVALMGKVIK
jgi:ABC-type thiamin/hydroxymethylpyrimidine transport system permease subunit